MRILEAFVALFGIIGAFLIISLNSNVQLVGFASFTTCNVLMLIFTSKKDLWLVHGQYWVFLVFSIIGIINRI